jgi:hypothetical protein
MAHNFAINDDVHHQLQGPQGRAVVKQRSVYTIVTCLPIEADGRPRYRIKSKTENIERVVTEEQISRLDWSGRGSLCRDFVIVARFSLLFRVEPRKRLSFE